jgi:hypothetical protein
MTALHPEAKAPEQQTSAQPEVAVATAQPEPNLTQQSIENQPDQAQESKAQAQEDPNWRAFREARKKDRAEKEAAEKKAAEKEAEAAALKAAMEAAFARSAPTVDAYQSYYGTNQQPTETEDQRIDRLVNEAIAKKEEQYKRQQAEYEQQEYPKRLMRDLPDFAAVCSQENLDYLDYHYPEISRPLQRLGDGYDKWHDTYHAVKKLIPNHANAKKEAAKADMNSNKPRSMSTNAQTPSGSVNRESWQDTEVRRAQNWERMQRILKGI